MEAGAAKALPMKPRQGFDRTGEPFVRFQCQLGAEKKHALVPGPPAKKSG
jgi:hypothetical protein